MLPQANRIKKKKDFDFIFKNGRSFKDRFLVLKAAENGLSVTRIGIIVSLKVSKKAVVRNKIRRNIRQFAATKTDARRGNADLVFIALPGIEKAGKDEIKKSAEKVLSAAKII